MKILLLGSKGMLGKACKDVLDEGNEVVAPEKKELDIISWDKVIEGLHTIGPEIVLNCAGFTDVDACEKEEFLVRKTNVEGPRNLAQGSARYNCRLIHISSDYVFNGLKPVPQPYFEDDATDPLGAYGRSKTESEVAVRENAPNYIIVRTGWLYGLHGRNFIKSLLVNVFNHKNKEIKVVKDQYGSPTWTHRLAQKMQELIHSDARGTYHITSEGYCSRFEYARHILDRLNIKANLRPCSIKDYPHAAKRPRNCILENRRGKKQGLCLMDDWQEDTDYFLDTYGDALIQEARDESA